jgi:beta-galactosidase GanA
MKTLAIIFLMFLSWIGFSQSQVQKVIIIDNFEDKNTVGNWRGTFELSDKNPSHGKYSMVLSAPSGSSVWIENEKIPSDWSEFQLLKFDIYNPSESLYYGGLQIFDEAGTDEKAEINGQSYRGQKLFLNNGWNHFEFLIHHAKVEEGDRYLSIDKIRKIRFSFGRMNHPLYLDNIRLVAGEETGGTLSAIRPTHCVTVIDDRYVYPRLAGPEDQIKPGSEIISLRKQAHEAIEKLKNEVEIAQMQGYQAFYERIPLIAANVGLGIRMNLVWFQNEKEETKILKHIIKSCNETTRDLKILLAAQKSNIPVFEPENDASPYPFYVPPFPPLKELTIKDGFYRDNTGKPVMIFSMLQVNEGPLMDYFAPFNHRIESYTVGGGSRYDIEHSPVYEAFHKHDDAKRVGWDGWCGHLIKDRWAMGGKKENVVICLESNNIREAILKYMQKHYREWINNPNLLYNIMAYELQYICYCDKSQQMFRDWLTKKYGAVPELNKLWETKYTSFAEITAPPTYNSRPLADVNRAAWYDWTNFNTRRFTDYLKWVKTEMLKLDPNTPICAGGTHSMLSSSNGVTGIDEEMIINEVNDVILNESGDSPIFSDLLLSLSEKPKVMVDPEMGGSAHGILLQFLHGKSDISKWWWASSPSKEYLHMNQTSVPHSKDISLAGVEEVLRIGLDVRRLGEEIAAFTQVEPEIAILYSKTSILQVPPNQVQAGSTPYLDALKTVWEGTRYLGCRIGFVSEKQVLEGKLDRFKLLIIPAAKYSTPEIVSEVHQYLKRGGTVVVVPESFIFDQYARENNSIADFGVKIINVSVPAVLGVGEREQNYDQSFSQQVKYENVQKEITVLDKDIFSGMHQPLKFKSQGLVQTIEKEGTEVLALFDDGNPALIKNDIGKGKLYYLTTALKASDIHQIIAPLVGNMNLSRPVLAVNSQNNLVTQAEVRAVSRERDYLVYASNLTAEPVEFELKSNSTLGVITDLRKMTVVKGRKVILDPHQETIFRIEKPFGK